MRLIERGRRALPSCEVRELTSCVEWARGAERVSHTVWSRVERLVVEAPTLILTNERGHE